MLARRGAGGGAEAVARAMPIFQVLGKTIVHVGPSGAGQVTKACNQLVVAATIAAGAAALRVAARSGVAPGKVREALLGGFAGSKILEVHGQRMLDRAFDPGFRIRLHRKDARIVEDAAHATRTPRPAQEKRAPTPPPRRPAGAAAAEGSASARTRSTATVRGTARRAPR